MKFLVLALCVCAASAASFGGYKPFDNTYKTQQVPKAFAQFEVLPVAKAVEVVPEAPVVADLPYKTAQAVVSAPVVAAKALYITAKEGYNYQGKESDALILRSETDVQPDGFQFYYETANGIAAQGAGVTKKVGDDNVLTIEGQFKYNAPDGTPVELTYVADENGYQPRGNILPVAPAIPEAILRSLEYIRTHPRKPDNY